MLLIWPPPKLGKRWYWYAAKAGVDAVRSGRLDDPQKASPGCFLSDL